MNRIISFLAVSSTLAFLSGAALADPTETGMYNLPSSGPVTLEGTIEQVGNEHRFMLRNDKGIINVNMPRDESIPLKVGDNVSVTGVVQKPLLGVLGSEIKASDVHIEHRT